MIKLYIIVALIYALLKSLNSNEQKATGIIGFFLTNFFLFPINAIKDIVKTMGGSNEWS